MGTIQKEYLIVEVNDNEFEKKGINKIDKFIAKLPKKYQSLFFKGCCIANGYLTYFMNWDGSKEGWDVDIMANEIRNKFIKYVKAEFDYPIILHIKPRGEVFEEDEIERYEFE